jgi:coenzyme F420 hydrogenase subunit beta
VGELTWATGSRPGDRLAERDDHTIARVVRQRLCTGCGTCVVVCPSEAVTMVQTPAGLLEASVSGECTECGRCLDVCPGHGLDFGFSESIDPFEGRVLGAFVGSAIDSATRMHAQSGGVVTALLQYLLRTSLTDAALVTSLPMDGRLTALPCLARTSEAILAARGSKYCPAASNVALLGARDDEAIAAVGLSCHVHGLRQLSQRQPEWNERLRMIIGLTCDRTLLQLATELMTRDAGLSPAEVLGLEYRSKARAGWPGELRFYLEGGRECFVDSTVRQAAKDDTTPPRCRLCFDKMNVLADITVGDPWGLRHTKDGESVIIPRTERGLRLVRDAVNAGAIDAGPVPIQDVMVGQAIDLKREQFRGFSQAWDVMGRKRPEYTGVNIPAAGADSDGKRRASYARLLKYNCLVAESLDVETAMRCIRSHRRAERIRSLPPRLRRRFPHWTHAR